jgi:uncharacterized membrane protein YdjX (TVP38/TMEM64 family)
MKHAQSLAAAAILVVLFAGGLYARQHIDVEFSLDGLESLRTWVLGFGWLGPVIFVALVTFRTFLFVPSALALVLGGIAFGALMGTALGALGLVLSAVIQFAAARAFGDDWVRPRLGAHGREIEEHLNRAGPGLVAIATAHPAGPMTPFNLAAGLSSMPVLIFALAVTLAGPVRAGAYAVVGSSILEWGWLTSLTVAVALGAIALLPLLHPGVRAWLLGPLDLRALLRDGKL